MLFFFSFLLMASYSYLQILELYLGLFLDTIFPCSVETLKGSIYGFSHTLFTLCHFETKKLEYFFAFGPGLYF